MSSAVDDIFLGVVEKINLLKKGLSSNSARQVRSNNLKQVAKEAVQIYFRSLRPELQKQGLSLKEIDEEMQYLIELTSKHSLRSSYIRAAKVITALLSQLEIKREIAISDALSRTPESEVKYSEIDRKIINTLSSLVPSAALSYQQVIQDLQESSRASFRGTAAELREVLRETLDFLAPDADVENEAGFKYEKDEKGNPLPKPTMKQKARFILKSRQQTSASIKVPESNVQIIEESIAAMARSTYVRGSVSTHTPAKRSEVLQLKSYSESILCELLEIHGKK